MSYLIACYVFAKINKYNNNNTTTGCEAKLQSAFNAASAGFWCGTTNGCSYQSACEFGSAI
jgi:hypothetical protein